MSRADEIQGLSTQRLKEAIVDTAAKIANNDGRLTADSSADLDMAMDDFDDLMAEVERRASSEPGLRRILAKAPGALEALDAAVAREGATAVGVLHALADAVYPERKTYTADDWWYAIPQPMRLEIEDRVVKAWLAGQVASERGEGWIDKVLTLMQAEVLAVNLEHGWFEKDRTVGDDVALLVTEVGEMMDAYREHGLMDATGEAMAFPPKPEGFGSECADVLIRLLDTCERRGVDLGAEYRRKLAYNRTRPHRHGGKRL